MHGNVVYMVSLFMGKCLRKCKKVVDIPMQTVYYINVRCEHAEVAELADAQASGACGSNTVWVQVPSSAFFYTIVCGNAELWSQ